MQRTVNAIINIKWEFDNINHEISLSPTYRSGICLTHDENVSDRVRCSHFPPQTAMWSDLWKIEIDKLDSK